MCVTCGCGPSLDHEHDDHHGDGHAHSHPHTHPQAPPRLPGAETLTLERRLLARNDERAEANRAVFRERGILAVNLLSSPGSGKTTLIERTVREIGRELSIAVIEGDQETERDAERVRAAGARAVQINTGAGCHLDAEMTRRAVGVLRPEPGSVVLIENVGNLVCPALFDLGERAKAVVLSTTEGEDKPLKYPHVFRAAAVMLLNKIDLLPHLTFDVARCVEFARRVNPRLEVLQVCASRDGGLEPWYRWLRSARRAA
jgi:hydrogenase nickel incorporation protein HypB